MYNIVVLDGIYANPGDLSWSGLEKLGKLTIYDRTEEKDVASRCESADIVVTNKVHLGAIHFAALTQLKLIVISATGTDHIDLAAAESKGIKVKNVVGYSTHAVAQHVFALIFGLTNRVEDHSLTIDNYDWDDSKGFSYTLAPISELNGKTIGIYGFGKIGQCVAAIGQAFGMKVNIVSQHADPKAYPNFEFMDIETLFKQSDIISLHAPLTSNNKQLIGKKLLSLMKPKALLINTARGALINEEDLRDVLLASKIGGAGLDVLSQEPPLEDHPLIGLDNCLITPHLAWASVEARTTLIAEIERHVAEFST